MNILIVDDDPIFNGLLHSFFEIQEVKAHSVFSLKEARQYLVDHSPDLIILDGYLRDGFGIELLSDIHLTQLNVPVMLVTADNDQATMVRYFEIGVSEYIIKPVNFELMWLKIIRLLETQQLHKKVVEQTHVLQQLLDGKNREEELAGHIFQHLANSVAEENKNLNYIMKASTAFNGDFLISALAPNGKHYTLLLDATGHGLAAAISILPLTSIFRTMVRKGLPMSSILFELNKKTELDTPDDRFVAGIMLEVDRLNNCLHIWNGGMPDVLVLDSNLEIMGQAVSKHLPLGIVNSQYFNASTYAMGLDGVSDVLLFSDGLLEQVNQYDEFFGMKGLIQCLQEAPDNDSLIETITRRFNQFVGSCRQGDDVSVCHANMAKIFARQSRECEENAQISERFGRIDLTLTISGQTLGTLDVVSCIGQIMNDANIPGELKQKTFTILTELYSNAFEHGVLQLDSDLKSLEDGFIEYFAEKDSQIQLLSENDKVVVSFSFDQQTKQVEIKVQDSGEGYDCPGAEKAQNEFSGRGLTLVKKLACDYKVQPPGNNTSVSAK